MVQASPWWSRLARVLLSSSRSWGICFPIPASVSERLGRRETWRRVLLASLKWSCCSVIIVCPIPHALALPPMGGDPQMQQTGLVQPLPRALAPPCAPVPCSSPLPPLSSPLLLLLRSRPPSPRRTGCPIAVVPTDPGRVRTILYTKCIGTRMNQDSYPNFHIF